MNRWSEPRRERSVVEDWWGKADGDVLDCLDLGPMSAEELGGKLGLSERSTVSLLAMLALEGKVRIARVERS